MFTSGASIGIDVGTSSTKALALTEAGRVVAISTARHELGGAAGSLEADPESWWDSTVRALSDCLAQIEGQPIVALSVTGQMSSLVLIDRDGRPVRPAMLLSDPRGADEIARIPPALRSDIERQS